MDAGNDILIRLYGIRDYSDAFRALKEKGIVIKRVMDVNDSEVVDFVKTNFSAVWAAEVRFALFHRNCHVAVEGTKIVGFFCIQATADTDEGSTDLSRRRRSNRRRFPPE